eukprot:RCo017412
MPKGPKALRQGNECNLGCRGGKGKPPAIESLLRRARETWERRVGSAFEGQTNKTLIDLLYHDEERGAQRGGEDGSEVEPGEIGEMVEVLHSDPLEMAGSDDVRETDHDEVSMIPPRGADHDEMGIEGLETEDQVGEVPLLGKGTGDPKLRGWDSTEGVTGDAGPGLHVVGVLAVVGEVMGKDSGIAAPFAHPTA